MEPRLYARECNAYLASRTLFFCLEKHSSGLFVGKPKSKMAGAWISTNGSAVDLVLPQRNGDSLNAQKEWTAWKAYFNDAGVPAVRVHDARHTAATTTLLLMGVDGRIVMEMMGWSSGIMLKRYQHVMDVMKTDAASKVAGALWAPPAAPEPPAPDNVIDFASLRKSRQG